MIFLRRAPAYDPHPLRFWFLNLTSGWRGALVLLTLSVLGVAGWKGAEIYHWIKVWRTQRLITQSEAASERGDYSEAGAKLREATALLQRDPITLRAVARYQVEVRDASVLNVCAALLQTGQATMDDKIFYASQAFRQGRPDLTGPLLEELKGAADATKSPAVLAMEAGTLAQTGHWPEGLQLARQASVSPGSDQDTAFAKSVFARLLLQAPSSTQDGAQAFHAESFSLLKSLALRRDVMGIEALEALVSLSQNPQTASLFLHQDFRALIDAAEKRPQAGPALRVGSWNLRLAAEPEMKAAIAQEFLDHFKDEPTLRLEAARWLNQKGMHKLVLDLSAPAKLASQEWLLLYLDANAALGKWEDVFRTLTEKDQKIPLPPALCKLFELRSALETGRHPDLAASWLEIMRLTRLENVEQQLYVAGYAEQIGFPLDAAQIYQRLLDQGRDIFVASAELNRRRRLACYAGLLRTGGSSMTLKEITARMGGFAAEFPEMDEVQNDNAYLQLLSGGDPEKPAHTAETLLQKKPQFLAYRTTAALAALRRQTPDVAASLYKGWNIDWSTAQDRYKAVYAAVMRAAGNKVAADAVARTINPLALRPEERVLAGLP